MTRHGRSAIIVDGSLAIRIGETLCEALYDDLSRQQPLFAIDKGDYWRVEGSWNRNGEIEGIAEFFLSIEKVDAKVTEIGELVRYTPHPSVVPIIEKHLAQEAKKGVLETSLLSSQSSGQAEADRKDHGAFMLLLTKMARGGVVFSGDLAVKISEILCEAHYGDLQRQRPLVATDKDTYWHVEGSWNCDRKASGSGPFHISLDKYDGRVTDMGE